jgi:hypothetical protein
MGIVSLPADRLAGPEQPAVEETAAYVVAAPGRVASGQTGSAPLPS